MGKHTPGPWSIYTVPTSCGICHKVGPFPGKRDGDAPRHACLYADYPSSENPSDKELEANARLIATAPELLEACQMLLTLIRRNAPELSGKVCGYADAAIAKATGEQP